MYLSKKKRRNKQKYWEANYTLAGNEVTHRSKGFLFNTE